MRAIIIGALASTVAFFGAVAIPLGAIILILTKRRLTVSISIIMLMVALIIYLSYHFICGNIDAFEFVKNCARFILPLVVAMVSYSISRDFDESFIPKVIIGVIIISAIDLSGVLIHIVKTLNVTNIYDIKARNLISQNTNYTAFMLYCALVMHLSSGGRIASLTSSLIFFFIIITFSRSYWAATLITLLLYYSKIPVKTLGGCAIVAGSLLPFVASLSNFDTEEIRQSYDSSLATKFEILQYSGHAYSEAIDSSIFGLGPKGKIDDLILTHSGHSLFGMLPELGLLYFAYIIYITWSLIKAGRYAELHLPGTFLLIFSTFPVSNLALHILFLEISRRRSKT